MKIQLGVQIVLSSAVFGQNSGVEPVVGGLVEKLRLGSMACKWKGSLADVSCDTDSHTHGI